MNKGIFFNKVKGNYIPPIIVIRQIEKEKIGKQTIERNTNQVKITKSK